MTEQAVQMKVLHGHLRVLLDTTETIAFYITPDAVYKIFVRLSFSACLLFNGKYE